MGWLLRILGRFADRRTPPTPWDPDRPRYNHITRLDGTCIWLPIKTDDAEKPAPSDDARVCWTIQSGGSVTVQRPAKIGSGMDMTADATMRLPTSAAEELPDGIPEWLKDPPCRGPR